MSQGCDGQAIFPVAEHQPHGEAEADPAGRCGPNRFKLALADATPQIGFWLALGDTVSAEICVAAGFDWVVIDAEHGPFGLRQIIGHLQMARGYPACHAVVRVASADPVIIKQHLDLGAQTVLVPMVESAQQAAEVVSACRYPPEGVRGIGGARSAGWGRFPQYVERDANAEMCVIVQVETAGGLANLEDIAAVEGVDGIFIGAADLSVSLGYTGRSDHPDMRRVLTEAFGRIASTGKPSGTLTLSAEEAQRYLCEGVVFVAVGMDTRLLAQATTALAERMGTRALTARPDVPVSS